MSEITMLCLKNMRCLIVTILLILPLCSLGKPYGSLEDMYSPEYSYDEDNEVTEDKDVDVTPGFVTKTMNLVVNEGDTIILPCVVTRLAGFVLLWRYNNNIITVGDQLVARDNRYSLESRKNGNNLVINLADPADQGEYVCSISAYKPIQIHHRVTIRVRPSIQTSPVKSLTVSEGEEARLYCQVMTGEKKHKLKWRRKERTLPSGEEEIVGEVIKFESVTPEYEGTYECVMEDEDGDEVATKEVQLHVEYGPVIEQEQTHILTDASDEYHITCAVHGNPSPTVVWLRDGHPVEEDSQGMVTTESGSTHILMIQGTKERVGGEYGCQATNTLGVVTKYARLSGSHDKYSKYPQETLPSETRTTGLDLVEDTPEEIENLSGLRIYSYNTNLRELVDTDSLLPDTFDATNDDSDVDKVEKNLGVTDLRDDKDMTKSFRGSFSHSADFKEIDNLQAEYQTEEQNEDIAIDIGWGWYHKESGSISTKNFQNSMILAESNESTTEDVYTLETQNYQYSKSNHKNDVVDKNEERSKKIGYASNLKTKEDRNDEEDLLSNDNMSEIIEGNEMKEASGNMFLTTSIVNDHIGEAQLENISPHERPHIAPIHIDIHKKNMSKYKDNHINRKDYILTQPMSISTDELHYLKTVDADNANDSHLPTENLNEIRKDQPLKKAILGDMFLTTSIATELRETHLENKSPNEKPYITHIHINMQNGNAKTNEYTESDENHIYEKEDVSNLLMSNSAETNDTTTNGAVGEENELITLIENNMSIVPNTNNKDKEHKSYGEIGNNSKVHDEYETTQETPNDTKLSLQTSESLDDVMEKQGESTETGLDKSVDNENGKNDNTQLYEFTKDNEHESVLLGKKTEKENLLEKDFLPKMEESTEMETEENFGEGHNENTATKSQTEIDNEKNQSLESKNKDSDTQPQEEITNSLTNNVEEYELSESDNKPNSKSGDFAEESINENIFETNNEKLKINGISAQNENLSYAEEAKIAENPLKSSPESLQIEWTAKSETPITIFRLQFMSDDMTDWSEVEAMATKQDNDDWYGRADLINLVPGTEYRVKVASKNTEGYNKFSRANTFATPSIGAVKQKAISSSPSSKTSLTLSIWLLILMPCFNYSDVFSN